MRNCFGKGVSCKRGRCYTEVPSVNGVFKPDNGTMRAAPSLVVDLATT